MTNEKLQELLDRRKKELQNAENQVNQINNLLANQVNQVMVLRGAVKELEGLLQEEPQPIPVEDKKA
jgi:hypothetical protein